MGDQFLIPFVIAHDFVVDQCATENAGLLLGIIYHAQDLLLVGAFDY